MNSRHLLQEEVGPQVDHRYLSMRPYAIKGKIGGEKEPNEEDAGDSRLPLDVQQGRFSPLPHLQAGHTQSE